MRIKIIAIAAMLLLSACADDLLKPVTIHLVGDSTMADKPDPVNNPERGWGQLLPEFFNDLVTVRNHAVNGRSTKSFIDEGKWNNVMKELKPGDYVFIQFGHNDQKENDSNRYSNPYSDYRRNLELGLSLSDYPDPEHTAPRVLVVVGGHSYDTTEFYDMLGSLEKFHFDSISHPDAGRLLASEYVYSYDAIMFYDFIAGMPLKDSSIYLNLARRGMPMLFLHHAICTFQEWEGYGELVGGKYIVEGFGNDPSELSGYRHDLDLRIRVLDRKHPVTRGMEDFTIHDEGYSNLWIREGVIPLLGTDHPDCSDTVGWVNHFDQSTIIYLIFGHDSQSYINGSFRQLLENALSWLTDPSGS